MGLGVIVGPLRLVSESGGAFFSSPIIDSTGGLGTRGNVKGCVKVSDAFIPVFASISTNTYANDAISPDEVLAGLISFHAPLAAGTYDDALTLFADMADVEGVIVVDSFILPGGDELTFNDVSGGTYYPTVSPGCYAVTIGEPCPVAVTGDINTTGSITSSDIIAMVHVVFYNEIFRSEPCLAASDVNYDGVVTTADIIYLVNRVFKSGPAPRDVCPMIRGGIWECEP
jgi:hypothetical protein